MSWESLNSQHEYVSSRLGGPMALGLAHQLSATRLLSSPDVSRCRMDDEIWPPWSDSCSSLHREAYAEVRGVMGSPPPRRDTLACGGCFRACRARIHQSIAKRKVNSFA
ncbi:unnamed protein product [Acanthoscelides obtectus]|uniref:Uncharacterized protein n=1 Tax=Acanthoscelides obtectus TaxID=200917 RepID=A0A9P0P2Q3_ACAOB|nr:unnamed protein product [Acanthoscelides obtectus]CAK1638154.1 hypothetical protein AOBTE_LOCUS10416 [Acanthoscelides obtectus]